MTNDQIVNKVVQRENDAQQRTILLQTLMNIHSLTCEQVAELIDCSILSVKMWRVGKHSSITSARLEMLKMKIVNRTLPRTKVVTRPTNVQKQRTQELHSLMTSHGLTAKEVAELLHKSPNTVRMWRVGKTAIITRLSLAMLKIKLNENDCTN